MVECHLEYNKITNSLIYKSTAAPMEERRAVLQDSTNKWIKLVNVSLS